MAKIVYGFGSSHGPLLATPPERWDLRAADDRKNPEHPFRGRIYTFPELVEARRGEKDFEKESSLEMRRSRDERSQRAMERLAQKVADVDSDIIVVVGDDQQEWFHEDIQPSFTVYCGDQVINAAIDPEKLKTKSPGIALAMSASHPPQDQSYPVPVGLATAIIERAIPDEFDVAASMEQRPTERAIITVAPALTFVYPPTPTHPPLPPLPT